MSEYCKIKNPLSRDGTSRSARFLESLAPAYASVDERSWEDLVAFAADYADYIRYYDSENPAEEGLSWKTFFENSIAVIVSEIARKDLKKVKEEYGALVNNVENISSKTRYKKVLQFILDEAVKIDKWYLKSIEEGSLHKDLELIINSSLKDVVIKIASYDKGAELKLAASGSNDWTFPELTYDSFSALWGLDPEGLNEIESDDSIYTGANKRERTLSSLLYINDLFDILYGGLAKIVAGSTGYIEEILTDYPRHTPHIALFLTFLELFKHGQEHLNGITKKHLDFYYRDVLKIQKRAAEPDQVHLIFELAKQCDSHLIEADTLLKAGKDTSGVEVLYGTDLDTAINKGQVLSLKSIFIDREGAYSHIYAAPVANSSDGRGGDFTTEEKKWKAFGESQWSGGAILPAESRTMENAEIGFALSSPLLLLREGKRTVTMTLIFLGTFTAGDISDNTFNVFFSGEKEWIRGTDVKAALVIAPEPDQSAIKLTMTLESSAAPVVPYDAGKFGDTLVTDQPVLKLLLSEEPAGENNYDTLKDIQIDSIKLEVTVDKVSTLVIQNETGVVDANKPFYPFGIIPSIGSHFYVGSSEIFQKKLTELKVKVGWKDLPSNDLISYYNVLNSDITNSSFKAQYSILEGREWKKITDSVAISLSTTTALFGDEATSPHTVTFTVFEDINNERGVIGEKLSEYRHGTERGFIRILLAEPYANSFAFGHRKFREAYPKAVAKYASSGLEGDLNNIPNEPYTPQIDSLSMSYKATEIINLQAAENFDKRISKFIHMYPFGTKEIHRALEPFTYLLPRFTHETAAGNTEENEGEFLIGIRDLLPPQNISILFQTAEGSADPAFEKQKLYWSYLQDNKWVPFKVDEVLYDSSDDLTSTGIITFALPGAATDDNTLLPSGQHWIRASVHEHSAAVSEMINLHTQAVEASFKDNNNDPEFLAESLPKEQISKLKVSDSAVKKITQPYASFNYGNVQEGDKEYYQRISERLRHKARPINIWDYERLTLENFRDLYKVKCLNHTSLCSDIAPGCVTLVIISNLRNKNAVNLLKPMTSLNTLYKIKKFLKKITSPFVDLAVVNPDFEEVMTKFNVTFHKGRDKGLYTLQLNEDLKRFLSPWAYKEGAEISFGGAVHGSSIINFIDEREYVDYITEFELYRVINGVRSVESLEKIEAMSSRSIIVSASTHEIGLEGE